LRNPLSQRRITAVGCDDRLQKELLLYSTFIVCCLHGPVPALVNGTVVRCLLTLVHTCYPRCWRAILPHDRYVCSVQPRKHAVVLFFVIRSVGRVQELVIAEAHHVDSLGHIRTRIPCSAHVKTSMGQPQLSSGLILHVNYCIYLIAKEPSLTVKETVVVMVSLLWWAFSGAGRESCRMLLVHSCSSAFIES
jgi:hypothetical protein